MDLNTYQERAMATAMGAATAGECPTCGLNKGLVYTVLGLNGEAGEYAEKVKKHIRDGGNLDDAAASELGDTLWYLSAAASALGYSLEDIGQMNIDKLTDRAKRKMLHGSGDER